MSKNGVAVHGVSDAASTSSKTKTAEGGSQGGFSGTAAAGPDDKGALKQQPQPQQPAQRNLEEIKAAARAYALSDTSSSRKRVPAWQKGLPQYHKSNKPSVPANGHYPPPPYDGRYPLPGTVPPPPPPNYSHSDGHLPPPPPPPGYHFHYPYYPPYHYYYGAPPPPAPGSSFSHVPPSILARPPAAAPTSAATTDPKPVSSTAKATIAANEAVPKPAVSTPKRPSIPAPPVRPPPPPSVSMPHLSNGERIVPYSNDSSSSSSAAAANRDHVSWTAERLLQDGSLDEYEAWTKGISLLEMDDLLQLFQDDDEDEYNIQDEDLTEEEEDDDDDVDEDDEDDVEDKSAGAREMVSEETRQSPSEKKIPEQSDASTADKEKTGTDTDENGAKDDDSEDFNAAMHRELALELGWLEEEDIEAAVASLLDHSNSKNENSSDLGKSVSKTAANSVNNSGDKGEEGNDESKSLRASSSGTAIPSFKQKVLVSAEQRKQLSSLLQKHYQLLAQQAVLTVRAAHYHKYHRSRTDRTDFLAGGETAEDLVEILDAAGGMLQDLGQNRKDAIRHYLQFNAFKERSSNLNNQRPTDNHKYISSAPMLTEREKPAADQNEAPKNGRRLTRAQFQRTLVEQSQGRFAHTVFDVQGLLKLDDMLALIDKSVQHDEGCDQPQLLELESNKEACEHVFNATQQDYDKALVPGSQDISSNFADPTEILGPHFKPPCDENQKSACRRNRNLFTAGEDNLVLRGVNLYGEKQWMLISDRFLPERSTNIISQRYSKLCVLLYKANGIKIDQEGRLEKPPKLESIDDINEEALKKLKPVPAPAILNVHRWSLQEDVTLLKAVPITGHMWAELGARLIPHRDRGHLRKRYQVLERRIKSTVERANKRDYIKNLEENASRAPKSLSDAKKVPPHTQLLEARPAVPVSTLPPPNRPPEGYPSPSHPPPPAASSPEKRIAAVAANTVDSASQANPGKGGVPPPSAAVPPPTPPHGQTHRHHTHHAYSLSSSPYARPPAYAAAYPPPPYYYPPSYSPPPSYPYSSPPYMYPPPPPYDPYGCRDGFERSQMPYEALPDGSRAAFEKLAADTPTNDATEGSRFAFERLAQKGATDNNTRDAAAWTHISELMKTENEVASAMAVDLARSPSKTEAERRKAEEEETARKAAEESISLLAGVLERANKGSGLNKKVSPTQEAAGEKTAVVAAPPAPPNKGSATKRDSSTRNVSTPTKAGIFSTNGSLVDLSPSLHRSPSNAWPKMSPGLNTLSVASFPAASQLTSFTPSRNKLPPVGMTPPAHSLDSAALQQLAGSEQSKRRKALFQDGLSGDDLEAISGLNLMANSPALPPAGAVDTAGSSKKRKEASEATPTKSGERSSSLFAKAVGNKKNNDSKKRKLVF